MSAMSAREQVGQMRREQQAADQARRTRANLATEARSVCARLEHITGDDDQRELLSLAELKVLGAAGETLREIARRMQA